MKKNIELSVLLIIFISAGFLSNTSGQAPAHDPTKIVKEGDRYYYFTTGDGIWYASASDVEFEDWQAESQIYPAGTKPAWINDYVPDFGNTFWAPGIIYMNGKWHIYYSCSTFGSQTSAIGLTTTVSLADRDWQDQGMVVHSPGWDVNAIDASVFRDFEDKIWLVYGSYWDGIVITELDSLTGKPMDPNVLYSAADNRCEAGWVYPHGDYYYLFFNRGACCSGIHSTYTILMGRSESPTGPFYDQNGVATNAGGGSIFLHSFGKYLGPGHFGFGEGKLTYHYYDGSANGTARLKVSDLSWNEEDWPEAAYPASSSLESTWVIANVNSDKVLQLVDGDTISGTDVAQFTETGDTSQRWKLTYLHGGYFKIASLLDTTKVLEIQGCSSSNGANVQIGKYEELDCQLWYIGYMGAGEYRIMSKHSRKALEIANASVADGSSARVNSYSEDNDQKWIFKVPTIIEAAEGMSGDASGGLKLFPNPSYGSFTIEFTQPFNKKMIEVTIYSSEGKRVFHHFYKNSKYIEIRDVSDPGVYFVNINTGDKLISRKYIIR